MKNDFFNSSVTNTAKKRMIWIACILFSLFAILIAQFYRIQIIEGDHWSSVADKQHYFIVKEPFVRGSFLSNTSIKQGHPNKPQAFAVDIEKFHLYVDPKSIPLENRSEIAKEIESRIDLSIDEKISLRRQFKYHSRSRKLAMWLDREKREAILSWWSPYARQHQIPSNALFFVTDYQRSYPFGKLLGQVLHTIQDQKDSKTMQGVPTGGLELYFNEQLKGKEGKRRLMRSPRHAFETGEIIESPKHGQDIQLSINHYLQAIAEEELAKGVKKSNAKGGWAVMMNPHTGEIWALAQYPFFYPPDYQSYFNDKEMIDHTRVKAITDAREPGSVMKPFTLTVALLANEELIKRGEKPLFDPLEKMATSNSHFPGRSKPLVDTHLHYYLNMQMALQKSSNIYLARLMERVIQRLGDDWYYSILRDVFKFGEKTGIELPAESKGVVPLPGKKHPNGTLEWSKGTPFSLAMGYNIQVNSIQLLRGYALLVNGGQWVKPTLLKQDPDSLKDLKGNELAIPTKIVNEISKAMHFTTKIGGTAQRANIPGYSEAGKTSTSKKLVNGSYSETQYSSSFIGFAPTNNPVFLLLVVMDEPEYKFIPGVGKNHHGGTCAAPVFRQIGIRTLEYLGIAPDDPYGYPAGDPRYDGEKAHWVKEAKALQALYEEWNHKK